MASGQGSNCILTACCKKSVDGIVGWLGSENAFQLSDGITASGGASSGNPAPLQNLNDRRARFSRQGCENAWKKVNLDDPSIGIYKEGCGYARVYESTTVWESHTGVIDQEHEYLQFVSGLELEADAGMGDGDKCFREFLQWQYSGSFDSFNVAASSRNFQHYCIVKHEDAGETNDCNPKRRMVMVLFHGGIGEMSRFTLIEMSECFYTGVFTNSHGGRDYGRVDIRVLSGLSEITLGWRLQDDHEWLHRANAPAWTWVGPCGKGRTLPGNEILEAVQLCRKFNSFILCTHEKNLTKLQNGEEVPRVDDKKCWVYLSPDLMRGVYDAFFEFKSKSEEKASVPAT